MNDYTVAELLSSIAAHEAKIEEYKQRIHTLEMAIVEFRALLPPFAVGAEVTDGIARYTVLAIQNIAGEWVALCASQLYDSQKRAFLMSEVEVAQ